MRNAYLGMGMLLAIGGVLGLFQNPILGLFEVNTLLSLLHVGSAIATVAAALKGIGTMRTCGKLFGFLYLALAILGAVLPDGDILGLLRLNPPDNLLHLAIALFFLYYALLAPPT